MRRLARSLGARSCAVGRGERAVRGVIAVVLAAFAASNLEEPWFAVPAAIAAVLVAIAAITGWCPSFGPAASGPAPNAMGHPEARQQLLP